ncbi:hypothetical protein BDZ91DRAFT_730900 [Kalaharituber pfeilii]|nr:hypothetical protein BDZ91DRAFT_730900 [Kalaharituber pfeilii]
MNGGRESDVLDAVPRCGLQFRADVLSLHRFRGPASPGRVRMLRLLTTIDHSDTSLFFSAVLCMQLALAGQSVWSAIAGM